MYLGLCVERSHCVGKGPYGRCGQQGPNEGGAGIEWCVRDDHSPLEADIPGWDSILVSGGTPECSDPILHIMPTEAWSQPQT